MYLEIPGMMTLMGGSQAWPVSVPHVKNHIRDEGDHIRMRVMRQTHQGLEQSVM